MQRNTTLSPEILAKLTELRGLLRKYAVYYSLCLVVVWCLAIFWLGGLLDYIPVQVGASETPRWARIGILTAMVGGSLWILLAQLAPRILKRIPLRSLALAYERHFPQLKNSLITAVELVDPRDGVLAEQEVSNPVAYREMLSVAHRDANERVRSLKTVELLNWQPLWLLATTTVVGLLLTVAIAVSQFGWVSTWANRLFGLSDTPWPRQAELRVDGLQLQLPSFTGQVGGRRLLFPFENGVARVPLGSDALLQVSANTAANRTPEVCTMFYRSDEGNRGRANLKRIGSVADGWQPFNIDGPPLDGIMHSLSLDIIGLDSRLRDLRLEVVAPAAVLSMELDCSYADYLVADNVSGGNRASRERLKYRSGMRIPEGTDITLRGTGSCELSRVEYLVLGQESEVTQAEGDAVLADTIKSVPANGDQFAIPLGVLTNNQVVEVRLIDAFGLPAAQIPRYILNVLPDTVPEVDSRLVGIGSSITPVALLPIRGKVTDDHAIAAVQVNIALDDGTVVTESLRTDGEQLVADVDLAQMAEAGRLRLKPQDIVQFVVQASDYYDLATAHTGQSQPQQLSVVTEAELLVLLDRAELEQRQQLDLIYGELLELRELLTTIKADAAVLADERVEIERNPAETDDSEPTEAGTNRPAELEQRLRRQSVLAQQCVLQGDKSQQELASLAIRVENLRLQLVNNRVDSYDRQQRLLTKVSEPLEAVLAKEYGEFQSTLQLLSRVAKEASAESSTANALTQLDSILATLAEIQANMLDMESFNEIIDLVRGLLDEQDDILQQTEAEQRRRILDLLN